MQYTLWCAGELLGHTDLAMPSQVPGARAGWLGVTPAFASAWVEIAPVIGELFEALRGLGAALANLPPTRADTTPEERGMQIHDALVDHPAGLRFLAAQRALAELALQVRDESGAPVPVTSIMLQEMPPPGLLPPDAFARMIENARSEGVDLVLPMYTIAIVEATGPAAPPTPSSA